MIDPKRDLSLSTLEINLKYQQYLCDKLHDMYVAESIKYDNLLREYTMRTKSETDF